MSSIVGGTFENKSFNKKIIETFEKKNIIPIFLLAMIFVNAVGLETCLNYTAAFPLHTIIN